MQIRWVFPGFIFIFIWWLIIFYYDAKIFADICTELKGWLLLWLWYIVLCRTFRWRKRWCTGVHSSWKSMCSFLIQATHFCFNISQRSSSIREVIVRFGHNHRHKASKIMRNDFFPLIRNWDLFISFLFVVRCLCGNSIFHSISFAEPENVVFINTFAKFASIPLAAEMWERELWVLSARMLTKVNKSRWSFV